MDFEVMMAIIGLTVAAFAAILGIWMERDAKKPPRYAYALSILILLASGVGMWQSWNDHQDSEKLKEDLARVLQMLDKIAQNSDQENAELNEFVKSEVAAQSRARPAVVKKLAQRVADEGGDANDVLGTYLPASEVESLARQGKLKTKPAAAPRPAAAPAPGGPPGGNAAPPPPRRPRLRYGERRPDAAPPPKPAPLPADAADRRDARDKDKDGKPDGKGKDRDGDGKPDKVVDKDHDGKPDKPKGKDKDGDGKPDKAPAKHPPKHNKK